MTDNGPQHERDDELLSAYLDDELSAEERAAVERRLAADPAARQMLDELRHVSQTVQSLPELSVGHDLRESILQRASAATPTAFPQAGDVAILPPISIGRSRRAWLWASLAVAAALLIAVFVPEESQDIELPKVVQATRPQGNLQDPPAFRANPEAAPAGIEIANSSEAKNADAFEAAAPAEVHGAEFDAIAPTAPAALSDATDTVATGTASASAEPAAAPESEPDVIVHVLAKSDALKNGAFERLLTFNGVACDPAPPVDFLGGTTIEGRLETRARAQDAAQQPAPEQRDRVQTGQPAEVEMVLVEAPSATIESCLARLNADSLNYVSLEVDDKAAKDKSMLSAGLETKAGDNLAKYNRGTVPQRQKELATSEHLFYYQPSPETAPQSVAESGQTDVETDVKLELQQQLAAGSYGTNQPRARWVQPSAVSNQPADLGANASRGALTENLKRSRQFAAQRGIAAAKPTSPPEDANLQVLFVLSCPSEPPPASPPAENPPQ